MLHADGPVYFITDIHEELAIHHLLSQVCLLDLDYNLPVQVRDTALGIEDETLAVSDVGKEYQLNQMSKDGTLDSSFAKTTANDTIMKLQRTSPYYKARAWCSSTNAPMKMSHSCAVWRERAQDTALPLYCQSCSSSHTKCLHTSAAALQRNKAPVCSFFVRGECKRGAECPYRHEMPTTGPLAEQNIKDRYYGVNDPVANKVLNRMDQMGKPEPPEDQNITTL